MKLTAQQCKDLFNELDSECLSREHRRGSTFYVADAIEITADNLREVSEIIGSDATELLGHRVVSSGYWDDDWGGEWYSFDLEKKVETVIPEKVVVIPEHVEVKWVYMPGEVIER